MKFRCKVCGYIYEGDSLPADYICPVCHKDASYFEPVVEEELWLHGQARRHQD